jgi:hypothetical protein
MDYSEYCLLPVFEGTCAIANFNTGVIRRRVGCCTRPEREKEDSDVRIHFELRSDTHGVLYGVEIVVFCLPKESSGNRSFVVL